MTTTSSQPTILNEMLQQTSSSDVNVALSILTLSLMDNIKTHSLQSALTDDQWQSIQKMILKWMKTVIADYKSNIGKSNSNDGCTATTTQTRDAKQPDTKTKTVKKSCILHQITNDLFNKYCPSDHRNPIDLSPKLVKSELNIDNSITFFQLVIRDNTSSMFEKIKRRFFKSLCLMFTEAFMLSCSTCHSSPFSNTTSNKNAECTLECLSSRIDFEKKNTCANTLTHILKLELRRQILENIKSFVRHRMADRFSLVQTRAYISSIDEKIAETDAVMDSRTGVLFEALGRQLDYVTCEDVDEQDSCSNNNSSGLMDDKSIQHFADSKSNSSSSVICRSDSPVLEMNVSAIQVSQWKTKHEKELVEFFKKIETIITFIASTLPSRGHTAWVAIINRHMNDGSLTRD